MPKKRLIVHAMSGTAWNGILGLENYEKRCLISAGNDDLVVLSQPIDPDYAKYREQYLGFTNYNVFVTNGRGKNLAERMMNDRALLNLLRTKMNDETKMDVFYVSEYEDELARMLEIPLLGKHTITEFVGGKSGFRQLAEVAGVSIAPGFYNVHGYDEVCIAVRSILAKGKKAVLKDDQGVSATKNVIIHPEQLQNGLDKELAEILRKIQFSSGVVEEWLEDVVDSGGIQAYITEDNVKVLSRPWSQILSGENKVYMGSVYPAELSFDVAKSLYVQTDKLLNTYKRFGWRGYVNFDYIILNDGRVVFVECNARKSAPYYPRKFMELQGLTDYYATSTLWINDYLKQVSFGDFCTLTHELLYDCRNGREGLVFYNSGLMKCGEIQLVSVAKTLEKMNEYLKRFNRLFLK